MRLQGEVAIVTGAGKGIGKEIALSIGKEGATVIAVARTQSDLDQTVKEIEEAGGTAIALSRDLTDSAQVQSMVDTVVEKYGKIDILVNNAGGYPREIYNNIEHQAIKIWDWTEEQWDQIIKTNLKIPFLCTNKVIPVMIKQHKGKIVNISSRMGRISSQMGAYACAKSAIITLTKTTALQAQEYGIQCNAIAPGILDTPGQRVYNHSVGQDGCTMGNVDCMGKAALYLLCDTPDIMTGQVIDIWTAI
ncbi:SDR family NAD(P)-dependent oxidoreductase [Sporofaciens sp. SGI.106]|uniref:SDR family NAD(P)-dependent oxidoreductase n=1 Tax=Sporofaciens sp. SGI.106 TaxID=3420568 RepID=UPI002A9ABC19|nr:SDR family NAD(P)-dependent oxidoreductase [Lachnoclostridium sp.]